MWKMSFDSISGANVIGKNAANTDWNEIEETKKCRLPNAQENAIETPSSREGNWNK